MLKKNKTQTSSRIAILLCFGSVLLHEKGEKLELMNTLYETFFSDSKIKYLHFYLAVSLPLYKNMNSIWSSFEEQKSYSKFKSHPTFL